MQNSTMLGVKPVTFFAMRRQCQLSHQKTGNSDTMMGICQQKKPKIECGNEKRSSCGKWKPKWGVNIDRILETFCHIPLFDATVWKCCDCFLPQKKCHVCVLKKLNETKIYQKAKAKHAKKCRKFNFWLCLWFWGVISACYLVDCFSF